MSSSITPLILSKHGYLTFTRAVYNSRLQTLRLKQTLPHWIVPLTQTSLRSTQGVFRMAKDHGRDKYFYLAIAEKVHRQITYALVAGHGNGCLMVGGQVISPPHLYVHAWLPLVRHQGAADSAAFGVTPGRSTVATIDGELRYVPVGVVVAKNADFGSGLTSTTRCQQRQQQNEQAQQPDCPTTHVVLLLTSAMQPVRTSGEEAHLSSARGAPCSGSAPEVDRAVRVSHDGTIAAPTHRDFRVHARNRNKSTVAPVPGNSYTQACLTSQFHTVVIFPVAANCHGRDFRSPRSPR